MSSLPTPPPPPAIARTIALMNQKGGVGKTTTTVNLSAAIARTGRRVLLIDLDPQAHASLHLGVDQPAEAEPDQPPPPSASVYDALLDPAFPPQTALRKARENLWVLPAETDLAALETELADLDPAARTTRLRDCIARLAAAGHTFDYILIDCPPSLGVLTLNGLAAAREVFIPMQSHFLALQGVSKLLETVALVGKTVNPRLRVTGVILCMHDTSSTHAKEVVQDLADFFEQARASNRDVPWRSARVLTPAIRRNIKLAECPSFGQTIFDYAPGCPGAVDYQTLADKIVAEWDEVIRRQTQAAAPAAEPKPVPTTPAPVVRGRKSKSSTAGSAAAEGSA